MHEVHCFIITQNFWNSSSQKCFCSKMRGLLTHDKGRTYKTITDIFESEGYTIQKQVLNAWDYGVAQKRERLITIGIRNDLVQKLSLIFLLLISINQY